MKNNRIFVINRIMKKMKKILTTLALTTLFALIGCSTAPSIEDVQESTAEGVESLLTEDNNENLFLRMDRYFLSEQVDELTYKGTLKATAFYKSPKWDDRRYKFVDVPDSTKLYRTVIIKFRDKKYDYYTISIQTDE